jgi:hypothetical protein
LASASPVLAFEEATIQYQVKANPDLAAQAVQFVRGPVLLS